VRSPEAPPLASRLRVVGVVAGGAVCKRASATGTRCPRAAGCGRLLAGRLGGDAGGGGAERNRGGGLAAARMAAGCVRGDLERQRTGMRAGAGAARPEGTCDFVAVMRSAGRHGGVPFGEDP